jgi:hypothetical protein
MAARCLFSMMQGYKELPLSSHTFPGAAKKANLKIKGPLILLSLHMGLDQPRLTRKFSVDETFFFLSLITTSTAQAVRGFRESDFFGVQKSLLTEGSLHCSDSGVK